MNPLRPPFDVCCGCGETRRGTTGPCRHCGEPEIAVTWTRSEGGPKSGAEKAVSLLTSAFVVSPALFCLGFALPELVMTALSPGGASAWLAVVALGALGHPLFRWTTRHMFTLWGKRWQFIARDGTRWGTVHALFGWYVAGDGVCLTAFTSTEAGRTPLSSLDALGAGAGAVASYLSKLRSGREQGALRAFDALMLATMAGLAARGTATISRARQLRWRKEWLRKPCSEKPELTFTIERCREGEDGGEVERKLLTALQAAEERLQPPLVDQDQPQSYREPALLPQRIVRLRLDAELLEPAFAAASSVLEGPAVGGAPIAVAAAIHDFGTRDPERMTYLCGLFATHQAP
ncbi:hypothetical protein [Chondromyces crocatus]|uniref:hypothetical protein n=1 Tax=Chondromyces crocatus TaxID=52 RepID=UPI0007C729F5|nr:hypothetical protein [Chondromyces crocatus]